MEYTIASLLLFVPLLCLAAFARWIKSQSSLPYDDKVRSWEAFIKLLSAMTVVVAGVFTFLQYFEQRRYETDQKEREFEQQLGQQQIEFAQEQFNRKSATYGEAIKNASIIATSRSLEDASDAIAKFHELYWGQMVQYEGREVEAAMVRFSRALEQLQGAPELQPDATRELRILSLGIATACRDELAADKATLFAKDGQGFEVRTSVR